MKATAEKTYRFGPFKVTHKNFIRLIVTDIFVLLMILVPALIAFAAEMLSNGTFQNGLTDWTTVEVASGLTTTADGSGAPGGSGGSVRFETPIGRNNAGDSYIHQVATGPINATDAVQLTFQWKKAFASTSPDAQTIYVVIQKPSTATQEIWSHTTTGNIDWTLYDQDVSSFFDENGVYQIRFGATLENPNDRNAQTQAWFDEISLDATAGADTTPPTGVAITDPTEGQFINSTYTISANATDETGMDRVEFYYDGTNLIGTDDTPPEPFTFNWDTTGVTDGSYALTAVAYDTSANNTTSTAVNVTVDNTQPTVVSAFAVSSTQVDVLFSEDMDGGTIAAGDFSIDNGLTVSTATLQGDNRTVRLDTTSQTGGLTYTVTVTTVADLGGNNIGTPNTAQFNGYEVDTTPPTGVAITDPTEGQVIGSTYVLSANATDETAMDRVEFYYGGSTLIGTDNSPPEPFTFGWDTTGVTDGSYSLTAVAYDISTNSTTSTAVNVTVDNTDPTSTITDPVPSQLIPETTYAIIGTADDTHFTQYTLDYEASASPGTWVAIGPSPYSTPVTASTLGTWDTTSLNDDTYTIRLITTDDANNSVTTTVTVDVDSTQPTVVSATAASLTQVNLLFSEDMEGTTVDPSYFTIDNGLTVTGAVLQGDNRTVSLSTSTQTQSTTYTVTVKDTSPTVEDLAGNIVGTPNTAQFDGFAAPTAIITSPTTDQIVTGSVTITGTADDPTFTEYILEAAKGKLASSGFEDIGTNPHTTPVTNGTLGTWDTSGLTDGDYTIQLTTRNASAQETVTTVRVLIDDTPPVVDSARAVDATTVDLLFREHISGTLDSAYFSISGLTVTNAVRLEDYRTVRLTTTSQTPDQSYTATVRSTSPTVADLGGTEIIAANNTADFTGYNSSTIRGDGMLLRRHGDDATCGGTTMGCHNLQIHSSDVSRDVYGTWGREFTCLTCHEPHGSRNIYLVKETITTPNSGDKTVDFRTIGINDPYNNPDPVPGTHDYSLGDSTDNFNDSVCEVCHTLPSHFRNVDSATPAPNHNNDTNCTTSACHPHTLGFPYPAAGESEGGMDCDSCHGSLFGPMNGDTNTYHHYQASATATYPVVADSTTLTATDSNKRCLMCHVDHDIFRPDLNGGNGATRAKNLRQTIKSTVTTTSNFTNSDYDSGHADGGICLSCHTNSMTKNNTHQKDDGSTTTLAIDKTQFDNATTAHNYQVTSTFASDTSTFNANCIKCHSDTLPKAYQGGSGNAFGLHDSDYNRMLEPLAISSPTDPLEESFCLECHTGGASADGQDYYTTTTMSQNAINVGDMFSKTHVHPISSTSGIHTLTEGDSPSAGWNVGATRHVECTDCHDAHAAQDGLHTEGSNVIGASLLGTWGVKPTTWGAAGTQHTNFTTVDLTATSGDNLQAYLCFKCHSYFAYQNSPPNTPSGAPDGSPAAQTDQVTEFNPNNRAHHAVISTGNHPGYTSDPPGLFAQTFVAPWGPGSTVSCSDCHGSDTSGDPAGPHGSSGKWILRQNETGVGTAQVFCYNCHRRDVYGDDGYTPPNALWSRVEHPINSQHDDVGNQPKNGIWCMNCHGGATLGGMHGTNAGIGPDGGVDTIGERFNNGAAITGLTRATTAKNSGGCWSKGTADAVNNCTKGHSDMGWNANWNY